jgi:hypothetical protein
MRATYAGLHVEKRNEETLIAGGELQERHWRPRAAGTKLRLPFHVQPQGGTAWNIFSKVSALVNLLKKVTM